jgi:hypothetical protein
MPFKIFYSSKAPLGVWGTNIGYNKMASLCVLSTSNYVFILLIMSRLETKFVISLNIPAMGLTFAGH